MLTKQFITFPTLNTERLTLRQLEVADKNEIFELRSDPLVNKFLDRDPAKTPADAIDFINKINAGITANQNIYWAITNANNGALIGTVCLFNFSNELDQGEIGYELLPRYQGQGYMEEALAKVISYGIKIIGLKDIEAHTHKDNHRSGKLLDKLGFTKEKTRESETECLEVFILKIN